MIASTHFRIAATVLAAATAATAAGGCGDNEGPLENAKRGVVLAFPVDGQLDVPTGARIFVSFSEKVEDSALGTCDASGAGGFCVVGPNGPVAAMAEVVGDGKTVQITGGLEAGTAYALHVGRELAPFAENLPESGPLVSFTTRSARPNSAAPAVIAVNGNAPDKLASAAHPMFEATTIRLVFSEPLDPRTVAAGAGKVELLAGGTAVPVTVLSEGIHVSIDPKTDLTAGTAYELKLGTQITDLSGRALAPVSFMLTPLNSRGMTGPIAQVLRVRQEGDPGPEKPRAGVPSNVIDLAQPLIGRETVALRDAALAAELGDPQALGGPIAFTIRRGQRLRVSGLDVKLGGKIPAGLSTGELQIELLTDAGGRIYRNPHQPAEQPPENNRAPAYVDLSMDVAVWATDPVGNAVLAQTVLGVQAAGVVTATKGVLAIETVASMELGLLGVTTAPSNLVLELITDPSAAVTKDTQAPKLVATFPKEGSAEVPADAGIELVFDEPVDIDRLRAGGVKLELVNGGTAVPAAIESHGSAVVVRPLNRLVYGTDYRVQMMDVADVAGNRLAAPMPLRFSVAPLSSTSVPMTVLAVSPGSPCARTGEGTSMPLPRCAGGLANDDLYRPFELAADRSVEVEFSQPAQRASMTLGTACGTGSVRIEELSAGGGCLGVVPGTLLARERGFSFVPDKPWKVGTHYRLGLVSGLDGTCNTGELCGVNSEPASFDPLAGQTNAGGPNLLVDFVGVAPTGDTPLISRANPFTDINGSGTIESGEAPRDENRAAMRLTGTTGQITDAELTSPDCLPGTPETEACMYLMGALPVSLGKLTENCPLPGGGSAPECVPVVMSPQAMYATSISMHAVLSNVIPIDSNTNIAVMRIREPASGPLIGYIIDGGGTPKLTAALDLYMDAPDLTLPLVNHNLHSKPLTLSLEGPVSFLPDGRIAIAASNTADLPVEVVVTSTIGVVGSIKLSIPKNEMKLQLVSPPIRGVER